MARRAAARTPADVGGEFVAAEVFVEFDEALDVLFEGVFLRFAEGGGGAGEVAEQRDLCERRGVFDGGKRVARGVQGLARDDAVLFDVKGVGTAMVDVEGDERGGGVNGRGEVLRGEGAVKAEERVGDGAGKRAFAALYGVGFVVVARLLLDVKEERFEFARAHVAATPGFDALA